MQLRKKICGEAKAEMKSKKTRSILGILMMALLLCIGIAVVFAQRGGGEKPGNEDTFYYLALGDSIPNGYSVSEAEETEGYPRILAEELKDEKDLSVSFKEYTKDGITAGGLSERYLSDEKVQKEIKKADLITVTVGANDILHRFRELYRETFGEEAEDMETAFSSFLGKAAEEPETALKAAERMSRWGTDEFEENWKRVMESIQENRKEDCQVIVTTLYNPVEGKEDLGFLNLYIERQIANVNDIITQYSETYGYQVAKLMDAGIEEHLQTDGLHPDKDGQKIIAEQVWALASTTNIN